MRLDKMLARSGVGTRSEVKKLIKLGMIAVNQEVVFNAEMNVEPTVDQVQVDGQSIRYQEYVYLMLHKPAGLISATYDPKEPTVMSLIQGYEHRDLHIVGRLDKDTTGLLLLTDDGRLTHHLTSPQHHIPKTYRVTVDQPIDFTLADRFAKGFSLGEEGLLKPAVLKVTENPKTCLLTIYEGKFHQIKRMFARFKYEVIDLHREQVGELTLGNLPVGQFRELTQEEIQSFIIL